MRPFYRWRRAVLAIATTVLVAGMPAVSGARQGDSQNVAAMAGPPADPGADRPLPQLKTHAPIGFRLYRPGYRLAGKGALVSAQLCRLPWWAGGSPQRLRVERLDRDGQPGESHEQYLPRLGLRPGNNCAAAGVRLDAVPTYGEVIKICAVSGRGNCP